MLLNDATSPIHPFDVQLNTRLCEQKLKKLGG